MKKPILPLIGLGLLCALAACTKKPEDEGFYFLSGTKDDGVEIYVNGNPTHNGQALSLFVVEGINTLEYRGDFVDKGYALLITKTKNLVSSEFRKVIECKYDPRLADLNRSLSFEEDTWWRWKWQDADDLGQLGDADRAVFHGMLDQICSGLQQEGFDPDDTLAIMPSYVWWTDDQSLIDKTNQQFAKCISHFKTYDNLVFERADREQIEFLCGEKIVLMRTTTGEPLYSLGPRNAGEVECKPGAASWTYRITSDQLYFVKLNGEWKLMLPVN